MSTNHVPFTTNNLREFEAGLQKMYFVFNVNDALLKENEYTYRRRDLGQSQLDYMSGNSLGPAFPLSQCSAPFMIQPPGQGSD